MWPGGRLSRLIATTTIRLAGNISNMLSYTCSTITKQSFIFGNSAFISTIPLKTQIYKKKDLFTRWWRFPQMRRFSGRWGRWDRSKSKHKLFPGLLQTKLILASITNRGFSLSICSWQEQIIQGIIMDRIHKPGLMYQHHHYLCLAS